MLSEELKSIASDIARDDMKTSRSLIERGAFARASAIAQNSPEPILHVKHGLVEYLGGAYYLRDAQAFKAGVSAYQANSEFLLDRFDVTPESLLVDLCLVIIHGPAQLRRSMIAAVMADDSDIVGLPPARAVARILAATMDLNRKRASEDIRILLDACRQRTWSRDLTLRLLFFSRAALYINRDRISWFGKALGRMSVAMTLFIESELERIKRGADSAITAAAFVDFPTAALASIAASRAPRSMLESWPSIPFSDYLWMDKSGWE